MAMSYKITGKEYTTKRMDLVDKTYQRYLQVVNGTENLTFEEDHKRRINGKIQKLLIHNKLTDQNRKIINDYYLYLVNTMQSIDSVCTYLTYANILAINTSKNLNEITQIELQEFFLKLQNKNYNMVSLDSAKRNIRRFFIWLYKVPKDAKLEDVPEVIKWMKLNFEKSVKGPDEVLTAEEIKKMAQLSDNPRDSAIHLTLFETGARAQEFLRLKIKSVAFDKYGAVIRVPIGKSKHYKEFRNLRVICCVPCLKKWIECHPRRDNPESYLWLSMGSWLRKPLTRDGLREVVKKYARLANIPQKKAYSHSYRHARCYDLISKGFTDKDLRLWFGWSNFSYMPSNYSGAYGLKDTENKILKLAGISMEEKEGGEEILKPKECANCGHLNSSTLKYCDKCNTALDLKTIIHTEKKKELRDKFIEMLMENIKVKDIIMEKSSENKEIIDLLKNYKKVK